MPDHSDKSRKTKFDIFLADGKGKPVADLAEGKINVRQLADRLRKLLSVYELAELYMNLHLDLGEPDESMRLFFHTLTLLNKDHKLTALGLKIPKGTVKMKLYRLKKMLKDKLSDLSAEDK
ncbi:unnamed protein product [marine sediment metagenome]|uniref:Uncharacterized protein n=1 Tax=marine sediment metagenome TaxID=412755 RepID=X1FFH7_9ZZZZ